MKTILPFLFLITLLYNCESKLGTEVEAELTGRDVVYNDAYRATTNLDSLMESEEGIGDGGIIWNGQVRSLAATSAELTSGSWYTDTTNIMWIGGEAIQPSTNGYPERIGKLLDSLETLEQRRY